MSKSEKIQLSLFLFNFTLASMFGWDSGWINLIIGSTIAIMFILTK